PPRPPRPTLFPYTTLFRSTSSRSASERRQNGDRLGQIVPVLVVRAAVAPHHHGEAGRRVQHGHRVVPGVHGIGDAVAGRGDEGADRKSTRLNSSHVAISYA